VFFSSWDSLLRIVVVGLAVYFSMLLVIRVSGKRTLAKLNAFDLVVTVAMGSVLATSLLSRDVRIIDGVLATLVLALAQLVVSLLSRRSPRMRDLLQSQPALLYFRGRYLEDALRRERFTKEDLRAAARQQGAGSMASVGAIVLETDGSLSVLSEPGDETLLQHVRDSERVRPDRARRPGGAG
jgi:uncharacterized membrane protein YcaP (DUF421 family)